MSPNSNVIRVIAANVDQRQLTLYKEDASTVTILQGDPRLARIVREITPILTEGPGSVAEVDLGGATNAYRDFEEQFPSTGIRFFKVARKTLSSWLSKAADVLLGEVEEPIVPPVALGSIPKEALAPTVSPEVQHMLNVTDEIIRYAKPSSDPDFNDENTGEKGSDTVVAVAGNRMVSNVERLKSHIVHAVKSNSPQGLANFMHRAGTVAIHRQHTVEELLHFLERADLPIADDGSIIIYKVLKSKADYFVDCHTEKVPQNIGSFVCMDEALIDANRRQECSTGLHVARRGYLAGFKGDVLVLAKVRPEDVVAVPFNEPNKMRVAGYHILFRLSPEDHAKLKRNQPFTDNSEAQVLLGRALSGDHPPPREEVRITGGYGDGVRITLLQEPVPTVTFATVNVLPAKAVEAVEEAKLDAPAVDPKAVVREVAKAKAEVETRVAKANRLFSNFKSAKSEAQKKAAALELMNHKKATKLGWVALCLPSTTGELLQAALGE